MMKYKLFVFDWDGTLVNSIPQIIACKQQIAKEFLLDIPKASVIKSVIGKDFNQAMKTCFPDLTSHIFSAVCGRFHELMQTIQFQAELFPEVISILEKLKANCCKLAIATSKHSSEMKTALEYTNISKYFDLICTADNYSPKPEPRMLNYIIDKLNNSDADTTLMIGDSITDIQFAKNAHVDVVSILLGANKLDDIMHYQPNYIVKNWHDFSDFCEGICS